MQEADKIQVKTVKQQDVKLMRSLGRIKHKIIVMSGKGGVGKSTVATNIAMALAMRGFETGILDADITGPNIPKMLQAEDSRLIGDENGILAVGVAPHLRIMSMAFLISGDDDPVIWRGPMKMGALRQFVEDVNWGDLDFLVVDLPPGTGDEPLTIAQMMPEADGTVIVTTAQDVALLDSRKTITFSKRIKLPVLGVIENMSGLKCPHCGEMIDLFKSGGGEKAAKEMGVDFLGKVPIDPSVVDSGDDGVPIVLMKSESPAAKAFEDIVAKILVKVGEA